MHVLLEPLILPGGRLARIYFRNSLPSNILGKNLPQTIRKLNSWFSESWSCTLMYRLLSEPQEM
jgi:hypothetical protein